MRAWFAASLVHLLYTLLRWSWRVELIEPDSLKKAFQDKQPVILSHWHGDELALLQLFRVYSIATIVSTSDDGQIMDRVVRWNGGATSRGSSTRGGVAALKGLIRLVRQEKRNCSFAVDGPKGPIYKVKPGVFEISKILELPIYAAGVSCDRAWEFPRSWNKTYLPKPFAHLRIQWFGPLAAPLEQQDPRDPMLAKSLEDLLHAAKQQARDGFAEKRG